MLKTLEQCNRKKCAIFAMGLVLLLSLMRLGWMMYFQDADHQPQVRQGVLDLRDWDGIQEETIHLDGEWTFFPNQLITGNNQGNEADHQLMQVPSSWSNDDRSLYRYGTYQLSILVDPDANDTFRLVIPSVRNASELYVNGQLIESSGQVTKNVANFEAKNLPYTAPLMANDAGVIEIMVQAANQMNPSEGGMVRSLTFGKDSVVRGEQHLSYSFQLVLMVAFVIHALYALGLFFVSGRKWTYIYTSFLILCAITTHSLGSDEKLLASWLQLDLEWNVKLSNLASTGIIFSLWMILKDFFIKYMRIVHLFVIAMTLVSVALILFLPMQPLEQLQQIFSTFLIVALLLAIVSLFLNKPRSEKDTIWIFIALLALFHSYIWWGIWIEQGIDIMFYPFDLLITIGSFTVMWFRQYFDMYLQSKEQATRLQQVAEEKDEFLAKTSHELRNPLHSMLNLTQTTLERNQMVIDQRSMRELETVYTVGRRLSLLVDDLLDMARLKITEPTIDCRAFYFQSIITGVIDLFQFTIDQEKVQLKNEVPDDLPPIYADENRMIQILYNLIHNAVKVTEEGDIVIRATKDRDKVICTVIDPGYGMDAETIERVLKPYEQEDPSEGVGLGMSISKQLIELHGEKMNVKSKLHRGTEVSFSLSISHEAPENEEFSFTLDQRFFANDAFQIKQVHESIEKANILMIDDDVLNLQVIESVLSDEEYEITFVQRGDDFLDQVHARRWDLLILDVMMPQFSGYDLTQRVRERFDKTALPILLLTARNHPKDIATGFQVGANDYVTKPVDAKELRARVSNLINTKQLTEQQLEMETKWLQAQIQPHFIFNTLNSINALSTMDTRQMRELVETFSEFLRTKFDFHAYQQLIPIAEELAIVESFLYIENIRFGAKLNVQWSVEIDESFFIPSLTIQPIVENAVKHGVMKQSDGGTIEIKAFQKHDYLRVIIKDDGVGMDDETIQSSIKGVGFDNTHKRLVKYFGTGLQMKSRVGVGTIVAFNLYKRPEC
ncbi:ATP-binding protein [Gracilibacillus halophilus]|nr:ATP-binding protein [Gracilibacillus halophilus]